MVVVSTHAAQLEKKEAGQGQQELFAGDHKTMSTSSYLVEVFSGNRDLQVVDAVELHLQSEVCDQQAVGPAGDHLGPDQVEVQWGSDPPSIQLGREVPDTVSRVSLCRLPPSVSSEGQRACC